jgi:hypothetical protein
MLLYLDSYRGAALWIQRDTQQLSPNKNIRGRSPIAAGVLYFSGDQLIVQALVEQQIACSSRCFGIEFPCHYRGKRDFGRLCNPGLVGASGFAFSPSLGRRTSPWPADCDSRLGS